jgi:hypothetical protein
VRRAKCACCGSTEDLQKHHIIPLSQGGENSFLNRVWLCKSCHQKVHKHGVGMPRSSKIVTPLARVLGLNNTKWRKTKMEKKASIIEKRKILKIGASRYISIPPEWFEAHNINPDDLKELLIVADKDIRLVNPEHEEEIYEEVTKIARKVKF